MEWFGWAGTMLFIICYMPQIYTTKKRKCVDGVSIPMWLIQWSAYTCCLIYSISIMSRPLMFGYAMGWLITAWWLELARQYKKKNKVQSTVYEPSSCSYVVFKFPHRRHHARFFHM